MVMGGSGVLRRHRGVDRGVDMGVVVVGLQLEEKSSLPQVLLLRLWGTRESGDGLWLEYRNRGI